MPEDKQRSLEEVMQEYANVCSEYGDIMIHRKKLLYSAFTLEGRATALLNEAAKLKEGAK